MSAEDPILTISVAANILGVHPRTLMLYEKAGLISPHRTSTKRRMFSLKNLEELQFIKYLLREKGVNLMGARLLLETMTIAEKEGIRLKKVLFPNFKTKKLV